MKKTILVATATLLLSSACGSSGDTASSGGSSGGDFTVAVANFAENVPLFAGIHETLDDLVAKDSRVKIDWYDNQADASKMVSNVNLMIQSKPDAIVLFPVSAATDGVSELLKRSKIPCVSVNIATPACAFLNISNEDLGKDTAALVGKEAAARGWTEDNTTVLIGQVADGGDAINNCVKYFYSTLTEVMGWEKKTPADIKPTTTTIAPNGFQFDGNNALQPAFEGVSNLASSIPKGNNIILYTTSNDSTQGALRALDQAGFSDRSKILVGGLAGNDYGLKQLADNASWVAEGDVFINYWGEYAVGLAQVVAGGTEPTADVTPFPQVVLSKDDLKTYHPDGTTAVDKLPALVGDNKILEKSAFLQKLGNIEGVGK